MSRKKEMPEIVRREAGLMPAYREFCWKIKNNPLVKWFRHSRLNPYHMFLTNIKAPTLEEAKEKAYELGKVQFLYKGTRYYSERSDCSVDEEYKKYKKVLRGRGNVADRIPRDKNGNLDLLAEDPIVIAIMPLEGPSLFGHVGMQYKDRVVNRLISTIYTDPIYPKYEEYSEYYFIYPSKLGIDPKKLLREMDKHNIRYGCKKFNLITNNCSKNVTEILEKVGVTDIDHFGPDKLVRFPTPGNNPFKFGLKAWCFKHGVHVHPEEVEKLHARYPMLDAQQKREEQEQIRTRYKKITKRDDITTAAEAREQRRRKQAAKNKAPIAKKVERSRD